MNMKVAFSEVCALLDRFPGKRKAGSPGAEPLLALLQVAKIGA
jgi:hypothetical protein